MCIRDRKWHAQPTSTVLDPTAARAFFGACFAPAGLRPAAALAGDAPPCSSWFELHNSSREPLRLAFDRAPEPGEWWLDARGTLRADGSAGSPGRAHHEPGAGARAGRPARHAAAGGCCSRGRDSGRRG